MLTRHKSAACVTARIERTGPISKRFAASCAARARTPILMRQRTLPSAWEISICAPARTGRKSKCCSLTGISSGEHKTGTRSVSARPVRLSTGVGQGQEFGQCKSCLDFWQLYTRSYKESIGIYPSSEGSSSLPSNSSVTTMFIVGIHGIGVSLIPKSSFDSVLGTRFAIPYPPHKVQLDEGLGHDECQSERI